MTTTDEYVSSNEGLKEITVLCMKCNSEVKVIVGNNFKGRMKKFCGPCKKLFGMQDSIFIGSQTDGCRRVDK